MPGIYAFIPDSGSGKTYLYRCVKDLERQGKPVLAVTFGDELKSSLSNLELIVLDRADMYLNDEIIDSLVEISERSIILLDLKVKENLNFYCGTCNMDFTPEMLEVYCGLYLRR